MRGYTNIIAGMITDVTEGMLFENAPVNDYPVKYDECVDIAKAEKQSGRVLL